MRRSPSTPPPDPEASRARIRAAEEQARNDLLAADCTPCYPADLDFPVHNVSNKYDALAYYQSFGNQVALLSSQLNDWEAFRDYQNRVRRYYIQRKSFGVHEEKVRDRRRKHGLEGDAFLDFNLDTQSQLQNWIEFQHYHFGLYDEQEENIQNEKKMLETARKKMETDASDTGINVKHIGMRITYEESKIQKHNKMLRWIEQQRITKANEENMPRNADQPTSVFTTTFPKSRRKNQKSRSFLDPIRSAVSKQPATKRKNVRFLKRPAPQSQSTGCASLYSNSNALNFRRSKRILELEMKASRHEKRRTPLGRLRPQKVTKIAKIAPKSDVTTAAKPDLQSIGRCNRSAGFQNTRCGRQLKRPQRLGFDLVT